MWATALEQNRCGPFFLSSLSGGPISARSVCNSRRCRRADSGADPPPPPPRRSSTAASFHHLGDHRQAGSLARRLQQVAQRLAQNLENCALEARCRGFPNTPADHVRPGASFTRLGRFQKWHSLLRRNRSCTWPAIMSGSRPTSTPPITMARDSPSPNGDPSNIVDRLHPIHPRST